MSKIADKKDNEKIKETMKNEISKVRMRVDQENGRKTCRRKY